MSDPTKDELLKSIEPKSDQLNADDLVVGPITVTITKVSKGDKEQPIVVELAGHRPYKPCKTMRRVLIAALSDDPKAWIGKRMTLFCDPNVTWAGVKVGGIRISHLSGLKEPRTFMLTQAKGKKQDFAIHPLPELTAADAAYIEEVRGEIDRAETLETLKAIGFILAKKPPAVGDAVRPAFKAKNEELKAKQEPTEEA